MLYRNNSRTLINKAVVAVFCENLVDVDSIFVSRGDFYL